MFDLANAFVLEDDLANLLQFDKNKTSQISILLDKNESTQLVADQIKTVFANDIDNKNLTVRTWGEINPILKMLNEMTLQFTMIFVAIILVALSFGIINTMLMAIMERVREIGMLMAIGMSKAKVFLMIMLETVFLSITGGILGILISWVAVLITSKTGIDLASVAQGLNSMGYSSFVKPELGLYFYFIVGLLVIFTAIIASVFPARKALKLNPAEAVRQDV
jgi:ABC-type antimicrobial peptide transport system permease subunit